MNDGAVHLTRLKLIGRSPAHYRWYEEPDAAWLKVGRALHSIVLGGDPVIFYPGKTRQGKEWEAFRDAHPGCTILSKSEHARAHGMAAAVKAHAGAMRLIDQAGALLERDISWTVGGKKCAGRVDILVPRQMVVELKSTKNGRPSWFEREALSRCYHAQAAWYADGSVEEFGGPPPADCRLIVAESAPPYPVTVFRLTPHALEVGSKIFRSWWERLLVCEENDHWPGYADENTVLELDVPEDDWGMFADDEEHAA